MNRNFRLERGNVGPKGLYPSGLTYLEARTAFQGGET